MKYLINFYKNNEVFFNISSISIFIFILFNSTMGTYNLYAPDSNSFIVGSDYRTPGYPLFLKSIKFFNSDLLFLPVIQQFIIIFCGSVCFQCLNSVKRSKIIWTLTGIVSICNPIIWKYTNFILSESLYISISFLFFGLLVKGLVFKSLKLIFFSSFILGFLIIIRPVAYAYLACLLLILIINFSFKKILISITPCIMIILAVCTHNFIKKDFFSTQIFGGYNIIGHTSHLINNSENDRNFMLKNKILFRLNELNSEIPSPPYQNWKDFFWITTLSYNYSVWKVIIPEMENEISKDEEFFSRTQKIKKINKLCWEISFDSIKKNFYGYLQNVIIHFKSMWLMPYMISDKELHILKVKINQLNNSEISVPEILENTYDKVTVNLKNFSMVSLFLFSIFTIIKILFKTESILFIIAGISSLLINANHLLVALVEPAIPRYIMVIFPLLTILLSVTIMMLFEKFNFFINKYK